MVQQLIDISIPTLTFLLMCIVGAELTIRDFKGIIETPLTVITAILGQIFALPLCAIIIILMLNPAPGIIVGLLLLAVCPGGVLSNLYVYLFAGNVALSVTLTALTTLIAVLYTPILSIWLLEQFGQKIEGEVIHFSLIVGQLFYYVLLPVLLGMLIRAMKENLVLRWKSFMQFFSMISILILVSTILLRQWDNLLPSFINVAPVAIGFTLLALLLGYLISMPICKGHSERLAIMIEFAVRNIPIALLIAVNFNDKVQAQLFAATYFVIHAPVVILIGYSISKMHKLHQLQTSSVTDPD